MRTLIAGLTLGALTTAGLVTGTASTAFTATAKAPVDERATLKATAFALGGSGFGTRLAGGDVPAGSDTTSWQSLGCTNKAGKNHENHLVSATLPGVGEVATAVTRIWTTAADGVVSSWSRNKIAQVVLGDPSTGQVEINGLKSLSRAFHDGKKFRAVTRTSVASVTYIPAAGEPQEMDVPTPGNPLRIPGIATIAVGASKERADRDRAKAEADALRVDLAMTDSRLRIAHSESQIFKGVKSGLFNGRSAGLQGRGLDDNVSVGYQPLSLMPCQGTGGELRSKSIADLALGDAISLDGVSSRQLGSQTRKMATGFESGRVASLDVNGGQLLITAVVGRVNITRTAEGLQRNTKGTSIGTITHDGEPQEFPPTGVLEIPNVARLERRIVERIPNGLAVTSLRVTLLDGSGAVLDLGEARLQIRKSGR